MHFNTCTNMKRISSIFHLFLLNKPRSYIQEELIKHFRYVTCQNPFNIQNKCWLKITRYNNKANKLIQMHRETFICWARCLYRIRNIRKLRCNKWVCSFMVRFFLDSLVFIHFSMQIFIIFLSCSFRKPLWDFKRVQIFIQSVHFITRNLKTFQSFCVLNCRLFIGAAESMRNLWSDENRKKICGTMNAITLMNNNFMET